MTQKKDPLLPRPVVVGIAIAVAMVWVATAVAAILNPAQAGTLITVSSLMGMVLGAALGIGGNLFKRNQAPPSDQSDKSGSETP